jgi:hypothetical protein
MKIEEERMWKSRGDLLPGSFMDSGMKVYHTPDTAHNQRHLFSLLIGC